MQIVDSATHAITQHSGRDPRSRRAIGLRYPGKVVEPCLHLGDDLLAPRRNLILEPFARSNCAGLPLLESRCENLPPRSGKAVQLPTAASPGNRYLFSYLFVLHC